MGHDKRILTFLMVLMLLFSTTVSAVWAADNSAKAGETVTVSFDFVDIQKLDGAVAVSDPKGIVKNYTVKAISDGNAATTVRGTRLWAGTKNQSESADISAAISVVLKDDATEGAKCTVTFNGTYTEAGKTDEHTVYKSATVTVEKTQTTTDQDSKTETPQGNAGQTETKPPTDQKKNVNYTELKKQITVANSLNPSNYSKASANVFKQALTAAKAAEASDDQTVVDSAAGALKSAIAGLKKINYAGLQKALNDADLAMEVEELTELSRELEQEVRMGKGLLSSEDQEAVDTAAERISNVIKEIDTILGTLKSPEVIEIEVPVEIPPTDDYCNIPAHTFWPMMVFLSLALNVVLVVLIVTYTVKKKKYQNDDTPLVNYDIDDDF